MNGYQYDYTTNKLPPNSKCRYKNQANHT